MIFRSGAFHCRRAMLLVLGAALLVLQVPAWAGARLLLADPQRQHIGWFARTVVLALDHGNRGSVGVVLNRPSRRTLDDMAPAGSPLRGRDKSIQQGGPVNEGMVVFLFRSATPPTEGDSLAVADDIYLSFSGPRLVALLDDPERRDSVRLFHGYSGWAVGQLENEIERKSWIVLPEKPGQLRDLIYDAAPGPGTWDRLMVPFRGIWVRLREALAPSPSSTG